MRALLIALALLPVAVVGQVSPPAQTASAAERFRASGALPLIDSYVAHRMQQDRTPGLALAITSRDGLLMVSTYGFADLRARTALTPSHLFEIGSISKSFTALALLQQAEAGRFDPRVPITKYLPWFSIRTAHAPITGHHLLTHTAGIPRDRDDVPSSLYQAAALRERVTGPAPGARYAYSNVGYQILGYALEAIAGRSYPDVVREGILRPLGMQSSDALFTHDTRLRLATGHEYMYDDRPEHVAYPIVPATWLEYAAGDGSIVSTPEDMAAYVRMLLNEGRGPGGPVVSPASFRLLAQKAVQTGKEEWYGYGLTTRTVDGRLVLQHGGGMIGYSSMLIADITSGAGAIVMINGPGSAGRVAEFAVDVARAALAGRPLPVAPPADDPFAVPDAEDYSGTFVSGSGSKLSVVGDAGRVWVVHKGMKLPAERRGTDRFYVNHADFALFLLQFTRDANKQVVEASYGSEWFVSERYSGPRTFTVADAWGAYPGHYRTTHAWFNNFRVVLRKGELRLVTPSGSEQVLVPLGDGEFALDAKDSAERLSFDTVVNGTALRATLSGVVYYRTFTP